MKKPVFNNIPNDSHIINGKEVWLARSTAVVAAIFALYNDELYILSEKRSDTMMDQPGKWVMPCGYIDWNENGWDCLRREVYEETSMLIDNYSKYLIFDNSMQPFYVMTEPNENRQNIVLNYVLLYDFSHREEFFKKIEEHKNHEIAQIQWIKINNIVDYDWAFNHDVRIKMALNTISQKLENLMNFVSANTK